MRSITNQRDARRVRDLPFCYSCGQHFAAHNVINHDHIPPQSIFAKEDRNFPLKLAAHEKCHAPQNLDDEVMGQLVSLIHGKIPSPLGDQLKIELYQRTDTLAYMAAFSRRNLEFLMRRWLKAFHAALYGEPLLEGAKFAIQTPFPSGTLSSEGFTEDVILPQHFEFVKCIKRNRLTRNFTGLHLADLRQGAVELRN